MTTQEKAYNDYVKGLKYKEIAKKHGVSVNTVKSWQRRYGWKREKGAHKKTGAPFFNTNAVGAGAPAGNQNAATHGLFAKYLPEETRELVAAFEQKAPIDILWENICLKYAAIVRAQQIMYVRDREDKTTEKIEEKEGNVIGERWEVQQAWDKQANFLKSQARAQGELRSLIKQYDEMLHKNWELATEEQKARIDVMRAKANLNEEEETADDGFLDALAGSAAGDWSDEEN